MASLVAERPGWYRREMHLSPRAQQEPSVNWGAGLALLVLAPPAAIMSVEMGAIASARVRDFRSASQLEGLTFLIIAVRMAAVPLVLFRASTATFRREEMLTKWKLLRRS
jgi:hypothetical protein